MIEISGLLGYYSVSSVNSLPTFRDNLSVPSSSPETDKLYWYVGTEWPLRAE